MGPILRAALIRSAFGPDRTFVDDAANGSSEPFTVTQTRVSTNTDLLLVYPSPTLKPWEIRKSNSLRRPRQNIGTLMHRNSRIPPKKSTENQKINILLTSTTMVMAQKKLTAARQFPAQSC